MRLFTGALVAGLMQATAAMSQPVEPAPGTDIRRDLLDALRPIAEDALGGQIEFVVRDLLVDGDYAFANVDARRPGGGEIDLAQSPLHLRDGEPLSLIDGPSVVAYLERQGGAWVVTRHSTGATDLWWVCLDPDNYGAIFEVVLNRPGVCDADPADGGNG